MVGADGYGWNGRHGQSLAVVLSFIKLATLWLRVPLSGVLYLERIDDMMLYLCWTGPVTMMTEGQLYVFVFRASNFLPSNRFVYPNGVELVDGQAVNRRRRREKESWWQTLGWQSQLSNLLRVKHEATSLKEETASASSCCCTPRQWYHSEFSHGELWDQHGKVTYAYLRPCKCLHGRK